MCGRFTLRDPAKAYAAFLRRKAAGRSEARFNIAPGKPFSVIVRKADGEREVEELFWGLIPGWSRPDEKPAPMINARSESVAVKPSFRDAVRRRRCLVPADGFYEWQTKGGRKVPYFFRLRQDRPFAFAGLWDEWAPRDGPPIRSFCLLTTAANPLVARIHDRMPAMLDEAAADLWLDGAAGQDSVDVSRLLRPFPADEMEAVPVDPWVNKVDHEGARCIEPRPDNDPEQLSFL